MIRPGRVESFSLSRSRVTFRCEGGVLQLTAYRENIVHVAFFPTEPVALDMWGIEATPETVGLTIDEWGGRLVVATAAMSVAVHRASGLTTFLDAAGSKFLRAADCALEPTTVSGEPTHHLHLAFDAPDGEAYYGLGQHQLGWSRAKVTPGVDGPSPAEGLRPAGGKTTWWAEVADAVSFFVIAGDSADAIYGGYRFLTGATPLPPLAAVGYIQCKQRYKSRDELMRVARTYREKRYPCDILVVDWFHWKTLGDLALDPAFWPDAKTMNRELAEMGYHTMISCWPRFMKRSRHYAALESHGWFMKQAASTTLYGTPKDRRGALIDTTNPEAAAWYWNTIRDGYAGDGFTSWWLDEDEPDVCPHAHLLHAGTGARVHNVYPLTHTRAVYEGHRRDLDERCQILSRSAYHGAQTSGATFWSSDIHPTWDVFRRQIPAGLNFCASGFAWWSSDIGGWQALAGADAEGTDMQTFLARHPDYPELYVRWFQFGAFCPTFRAHGTRPENEVWSFGVEAERVLVRYLRLRYRLLPYIYSLARHTHRTGAPFMRALFMDFPDDPNVRDVADAYMFGPAFLVAPVVEQGATTREVYLPAGTHWYNYRTNEKHPGGRTLTVQAPLDTLPLFVRAGSIVPHGEAIQHTGETQTHIELHVYEGADGQFDLYRDDGRTYAYERGDFTLTRIAWHDAAKTIRIDGDDERLFAGPQSEWLKRIGQETTS